MPGLSIALVGLGSFGLTFVPLYRDHPDVRRLVLCDLDGARTAAVAEAFGVADTAISLDAVLADRDVDAVHLITPMHLHAAQAVATMEAGKHCACAVPAGLTLDELRALVEAEQRTGRTYMMMETAVYTREFRYAQQMVQAGALGRVQFLRGTHYSDYETWPAWKWYPPMAYATHVVGPLLSLAGTRAASVRCLGSGVMPEALAGPTGNPFPVETAIFDIDGLPLAMEVSRSIFRLVRQVQESFSVYGDRASFEWQQLASEHPVVFRTVAPEAGADDAFEAALRNFAATLGISYGAMRRLLPQSRFPGVSADRVDVSTLESGLPPGLGRGGGHGGAEAHLVHEFVRSIVEERRSAVDAVTAADWTAPGLCAHESALSGGAAVAVPDFTK